MPATYSANFFKKAYALYDGETGTTYRVKVRLELGTQTGLGADGAADGGIWTKNHKYLRRAHYKGEGVDQIVKRTYPCSRQYWIDHADLNHTITMDGLTLHLTGFSGEDLHG